MDFVVVKLTEGNIRNNHLYLSSVIDFFPAESIGGSNDSNTAEVQLEIHSGIEKPVVTDIAGDKKIFRKRSWVKEFFQSHNLKAGDKVVIERTGSNRYHVFPVRLIP